MKIAIEHVPENNCIKIIPEDFNLYKLRGITSYIKLINGKVVDNEYIEVSLDEAEAIDVYNKIRKIFEDKFDCEIISSITAKKVFDEAETEAQKFSAFSKKAYQIRNNNITSGEFKSFCDVLADTEFKRSLKPYQLLAAYHIAFSQNACNFSVPGSGKTSTVLAAFEYLRKQDNDAKTIDKLVVIGPLSAFIAWKLEYEACFGYEPKTLEIRGGVSKKLIEQNLLTTKCDLDLVMISYGSVQGNYNAIVNFLKHYKCMVVLDEAHRIKKVAEDAQSNYVLSLAPLAKSRVVLTGTPAANSYIDLYNLYKFIWPFNNVIGYSVAQLSAMNNDDNDVRVTDLINRISPFFIRVKKSDLGLPEAVFEEPEPVAMSDIQKEIYEAIERILINKYESNNLPAGIRRAAAIRLRQAASNPGLLLKPLEEDFFDYEGDWENREKIDDFEVDKELVSKIMLYKKLEIPNKFKRVLQLTREIVENKEKVIIWCEFIGTCDDLSEYLELNGMTNRILYGKCMQDERENIIKEFLSDDSTFNVIVANPHAVGESISLHTACHNAIYLEQGFNAGVYMQSKDRIHRVGLKDGIITRYYFIQSKDSVDSVVFNRVLQKEKKMLELIEGQEIPLLANIDYEENSEEDVKAIIKDYYERRKRII